MEQRNGTDQSADSLQREPNEQLSQVYGPRPLPSIITTLTLSLVGIGGIAIVIWASQFFTDTTAAVAFIAGSILNLFIFLAIVAQACIYWAQRTLMEKQWKAMQDSLEETRHQIGIAERQLGAMEASTNALIEQIKVIKETEAPYFGTPKIVFRYVANRPDGAGGLLESRQPEVIITFLNGGKTPAWHLLVVPHLVLGKSPDEGKWIDLNVIHDRECPDSENTFYPSGAEKCMKFQGRGEVGTTEFEAINSGTQALFLVIDIGYTDMRNMRETRTLKRELNPRTHKFGDWGSMRQS